jgi:hypothetical protein
MMEALSRNEDSFISILSFFLKRAAFHKEEWYPQATAGG